MEAEAALVHPATPQHIVATEVAESLLKDRITVQQYFQNRRTGSLIILQKYHIGLQRLPHHHIATLAEYLLARHRIDTPHHQRLPVVHPAEHLLIHFRIGIWRLQLHLL